MSATLETSVYQRAELDIEILFPIAITRLTQVFTNPSDTVIEAIYQFPVPTEAVLGDVSLRINHERYTGVIKRNQEAIADYEEAVCDAKRAVLIKDLGDGLMELNAGNLAPGDELSITLSINALLDTLNDDIRYHLPTCIAPRYGASTLDEFSTPVHSLFAHYPFTAHVQVHTQSNVRLIDCTHELEDSGQGMRFKGFLDQDISLQFQRLERLAIAWVTTVDNDSYSVANFSPVALPKYSLPANIQLVVDCSGSMNGRSIGQVRKGLGKAFEALTHHDQVNLIRFGSNTESVLKGLRAFEGKHRDVIEEVVYGLDADLGGTEMLDALEVALAQMERFERSSLVLLTDGQIWEDEPKRVEKLIKRASLLGVRIFCIGVGDNIDDAFLSKLSQQTHGRLYRANPHEDLAHVISQTISQTRNKAMPAKVEVQTYTVWQSPICDVLEGESPTVLACSSSEPEHLRFECVDHDAQIIEPMTIPKEAQAFERAVMQLCVHQRLRALDDSEVAGSLAERAQVVSAHTSFIMVDDVVVKGADGFPLAVQVPQSLQRDYLDIPMFCRRVADSSQDAEASYMQLARNVGERVSHFFDSDNDSHWLDLKKVERYLNRRVFKVQQLDFDFIRLCGGSSHIASQLEALYLYALQEGDEVFTVDSFVARFLIFYAGQEDHAWPPRVLTRLRKLLWESDLPLEEYFEELEDWQEVLGV